MSSPCKNRTIDNGQLTIIVNQKWIAKNPLILYIEHRGTEARRNKYIEKESSVSLCLCVPFHFFANQFCFTIIINANQELNVVKFHRSYHFVQKLYFTWYLFVHFVYAT